MLSFLKVVIIRLLSISVVNAGLHRHGCRAITGIALSSTKTSRKIRRV